MGVCSWTPESVTLPSHGWALPTGVVPDGLPFSVERVGVAGNLPVYRDIRHGRTKVYTTVRKIRGDVEALAVELHKVSGGARVTLRPGRVDVHTDCKEDIVKYLSGLGL
jgi:hypothetical protein